MAATPLPVTGDDAADSLLAENPFALLLGMLLDQQVPMEWAFRAPATLTDRLGDELTPTAWSRSALTRSKPSSGTSRRCTATRDRWASGPISSPARRRGLRRDAAAIWTTAPDAAELYRRIRALPGFGEEKARIFLALLAKRFDAAPAGWQEHAGPFADDMPRSVADVSSEESLQEVRAWKKAQKAKGKSKAD